MARAPHPAIRRHGYRGNSRSILPRQRCRLDSRTGSWSGNSVGRELLFVARAKEDASATGREIPNRKTENTRAGIGMDSNVAEGTTRQRQGAYQFLRSIAESGNRETCAGTRDFYP